MARPRKNAAAAAPAKKSSLLAALEFCAPGFKENGEAYAQHAFISGGYVSTYDGVVMYSHPITENLQCLPAFDKLIAAMRKCGATSTIAQPDAHRLEVRSGGFRAVVPCLADPALVTRPPPDQGTTPADERLREAFGVCNRIASETSEHVMTASVHMEAGVCTATDGKALVQFYHGIPSPAVVIPRIFTGAVAKIAKPIAGFGLSETSFTLYFQPEEGDTRYPLIRTQLYQEQWSDFAHVIPNDFNQCQPVPAEFFAALASLKPFTKPTDRGVFLFDGEMRTHLEAEAGASLKVAGLAPLVAQSVSVELLAKLEGAFTHIDYASDPRFARFVGSNVRGVVGTIEADAEAWHKAASAAPKAAATPAGFSAPA